MRISTWFKLAALVVAAVIVIQVGKIIAAHGGSACGTASGAMAHADTGDNCLHQEAGSSSWAEAQQRQMAGATVTTGLLYTDANGSNPTTLTSGESGEAFELAWQYLRANASSIIRDLPPGQQAAGHVETKAAALMRHNEDTYGVLVIHNDEGPCTWASGPGCVALIDLILPKGSTMVLWWPGGHHET